MKSRGILNIALSGLIASLGHGDKIAIVDRGFPIPAAKHVEVVDLAISKNLPTVQDVLAAICAELTIEAIMFAKETIENSNSFHKDCKQLINEKNIDITEEIMSHNDLKDYVLSGGNERKDLRGYIRTGDFTFFGYLVITAGVDFWK